MNELSNKDLDKIVEVAKTTRMENINNTVTENIQEELIQDTVENSIDGFLIPNTIETMPSANVNIFDINKESIDNASLLDNAKESFDLSDNDAYQILKVVSDMNSYADYSVYKNLPDKLKDMINEIIKENNIPLNQKETVARMIMNEFSNDSEIEKTFIDLEKSIDEALNMPSIVDLYSEHTKNVMENHIPNMIEAIKNEAPEKAEMLRKIKDMFTKSYNYSFAIDSYNNNSRLRKAIRRYKLEFKRCMEDFNFKNDKSNFKMNDVREIANVLHHILIDQPKEIYNKYSTSENINCDIYVELYNTNITDEDIQKFCILICKSCENMNPYDVIDAAYMYYMMKNIIVLKHTQEAKTDFALELISNIRDTIVFIRNKEAEFYESNMEQSEYRKKHNSKKHNKK